MRMIYILMAVASMCTVRLWGQTPPCPGSERGITTNPDAPTNPECPTQINTFDWRQTHYPFYWSGDPNLTSVWSPFWNSSNVNIELWDELFGGKDYHPADGWELIKRGVAPDIINFNYVVLYNKYTSILRVVFALPPTQEDYQFIKVNLEFPRPNASIGNVTALLHPRTGQSQAMDRISVTSVHSSVVYTQLPDYFMYADFPVEYDPCTCMQNSSLNVSFSRIKKQELVLYGRNLLVERTLANIQSFSGELERDFLTQTYMTNIYTEGLAGTHTFSTYDRLVGHYGVLRQQQAELNKQYAFFKIFNEVVKSVGAVGAPVLKGVKASNKKKLEEKANILGINISELGLELSGSTLLEGITGVVNLFGAPIKSELDAVGNRVNSLGSTVFSHGEMALKGNIETEIPDGRSISFRTPGQNTACTGTLGEPNKLYPLYNETLGRFALLETPRVVVQKYIFPPAAIYSTYKFDPASLRYSFNPAAKINPEGTEIWAAIQFVGDANTSYSHNLTIVSEEAGGDIFQTPIIPLNCLGKFTAGFLQALIGTEQSPQSAVLKLFVDFEFLDGKRAIQMYSYPLNISDINDYIVLNETGSLGILQVPYYESDITLEATHFTESQTIFAWSNITIKGDLTAAPGVTVEILAPNIEVLNESFIGSDIWLRNDFTPFGNCTPLSPVSNETVVAFCNSTSYQANRASFASQDEEVAFRSDDSEDGAIGDIPFSISIAPNPVSDYSVIRVLLPDSGDLRVFLNDVYGRPVKNISLMQSLPAGEHIFDLSSQGLPAGMYILSVQSGQSKRSAKVVIR